MKLPSRQAGRHAQRAELERLPQGRLRARCRGGTPGAETRWRRPPPRRPRRRPLPRRPRRLPNRLRPLPRPPAPAGSAAYPAKGRSEVRERVAGQGPDAHLPRRLQRGEGLRHARQLEVDHEGRRVLFGLQCAAEGIKAAQPSYIEMCVRWTKQRRAQHWSVDSRMDLVVASAVPVTWRDVARHRGTSVYEIAQTNFRTALPRTDAIA